MNQQFKKAIVAGVLLLLTLSINAQPNFHIGYGYDITHYPVASVGPGFEINQVVINTEVRFPAERNASDHVYAGGTVGFNFLPYWKDDALIASIGGYSNAINSDQKRSLSMANVAATLRYVRYVAHDGSLYAEVFYIHNTMQLTAGMMIKFK